MKAKFTRNAMLVAGGFVILSLVITQPIIKQAEREVQKATRIIARLLSGMIYYLPYDPEMRKTVSEVIKGIGFPIIITDQFGIPRAWEGVGVPFNALTQEELNRPDKLANNPYFRKLLQTIRRLRNIAEPIPIVHNQRVVGYLYHGYPHVLSYMRILPLIFTAITLILAFIFYYFARSVHEYEIENLWVSFAKGLAHQMGTPVSALLGWLELLKVEADVPEYILENMEEDLERLQSILRRFSRVGGKPDFKEYELSEVIENTIEMLKRRFLKEIEIKLDLTPCKAYIDKELFSWALENLIKNSYEARNRMNPRIEITLRSHEDGCKLLVSDNGQGIPKEMRKKLFKESFSTKERGWGVGLIVARRIIEDIHKGRIRLVDSKENIETTFEIFIPTHPYHE